MKNASQPLLKTRDGRLILVNPQDDLTLHRIKKTNNILAKGGYKICRLKPEVQNFEKFETVEKF